MHRIRSRTERGASAVEFALVVPFLCLLLIGMVTTGLVYSDHLALTNAVREGARYGASADMTSGTWASDVRDRVKQTYMNHDGIDVRNICARLINKDGPVAGSGLASLGDLPSADCGGEPSDSTFRSGMTTGSCAVKVWAKLPERISLVVAPDLTFNIGANSIAYYGRVTTPCPTS